MKIVLMCVSVKHWKIIEYCLSFKKVVFCLVSSMRTANPTLENVQELGEDLIFAATQHTEIYKYFL